MLGKLPKGHVILVHTIQQSVSQLACDSPDDRLDQWQRIERLRRRALSSFSLCANLRCTASLEYGKEHAQNTSPVSAHIQGESLLNEGLVHRGARMNPTWQDSVPQNV